MQEAHLLPCAKRNWYKKKRKRLEEDEKEGEQEYGNFSKKSRGEERRKEKRVRH